MWCGLCGLCGLRADCAGYVRRGLFGLRVVGTVRASCVLRAAGTV